MEVSRDSGGMVDAIPMSVVIAEVSCSVDQGAALEAGDTRNS